MPEDVFTERLAQVRRRFASTLERKIEDTYGALPNLTGDGPKAVDALGETYRRIHSIAGIGKAVGFAATGRAARDVENVLLQAHFAKRGLQSDEMAALEQQLHQLRDAAQRELDLASTSGM
jgi:chemotaxis protein histidine kinase CheA